MSRRLLTWPLVVVGPALRPSRFPQRALIGGCGGSSAALRAPTACFLLFGLLPPTHCVSCLKCRGSALGLCFYENGRETPRTLALHLGLAVFHVPS